MAYNKPLYTFVAQNIAFNRTLVVFGSAETLAFTVRIGILLLPLALTLDDILALTLARFNVNVNSFARRKAAKEAVYPLTEARTVWGLPPPSPIPSAKSNGVFVPLMPVSAIENGAQVAFEWPDDVYLCDSNRKAALDAGRVILLETIDDDDE